MTPEFLEEVDTSVIPYILRRLVKENKRYRKTKPFHGRRSCEDRATCAVHAK